MNTPAPDYGEPWEFAEWNAGVNRSPGYGLLSSTGCLNVTVHTTEPDGPFRDKECVAEAKRKAQRIVACVNALAGIHDPAAHLASLNDTLESAIELIRRVSTGPATPNDAWEWLKQHNLD